MPRASSSVTVRIAVDAMGGDVGPGVTVPGALLALSRQNHLAITLFGDESAITPWLKASNARQWLESGRLAVRHCTQLIVDERPAWVLREGTDTAIGRAIEAHAKGEFDGCVSAGHTGVLLALGRHWLKTFPGIDRPALCTAAPALGGHVWLLDMGANLDCTDLHLYQFARMAHHLACLVDGNSAPRVALLNIGSEAGKGPPVIRSAAERLRGDSYINFIGYIEGDRVFAGDADIVVCNGFAGNIVLKSSEGLARTLVDTLRTELRSSWLSRLGAWLCRPALRRFGARIDPGRYNGAPLLGLRGVVVKSHGGAEKAEFSHAIGVAATQAAMALTDSLASAFTDPTDQH